MGASGRCRLANGFTTARCQNDAHNTTSHACALDASLSRCTVQRVAVDVLGVERRNAPAGLVHESRHHEGFWASVAYAQEEQGEEQKEEPAKSTW